MPTKRSDMTEFQRFAVYYAPRPGAFSDFANGWLGWDAVRGRAVPHPDIPGLPLPIEALTRAPRKYGFHGTLKPPFRLRDGQSRAALEARIAELAARLAPVICDGLDLRRIGRFLALTPRGDTRALSDLAATVVRDLDPFRAAPGLGELERRRAAGLSPRQNAYLESWGYPYVMDEFRFHLTLTDKLSDTKAKQTQTVLEQAITPLPPQPFEMTDLCLFGEAADGRFHLLHRYALSG
ncbi:DUF1045 domain-containing protein [Actibacterium sp.]|uniref:DUF1045 domain-containing protein n=1 Tax=Actibacterium sp. TaxID=1872125 RepID=UPI003562F6FB